MLLNVVAARVPMSVQQRTDLSQYDGEWAYAWSILSMAAEQPGSAALQKVVATGATEVAERSARIADVIGRFVGKARAAWDRWNVFPLPLREG